MAAAAAHLPVGAVPRKVTPGPPAPATLLAAGYTLFEMLIVLAILGLVAGLVLTHGPPHSTTLDLRSSTIQVMQILRVTRVQAITTHRPQSVLLDLAARSLRAAQGAPYLLPPRLGFTMVSGAEPAPARISAITFAPDGSSSGGRIELSEGGRRVTIGVDWLTGRVDVADGR